MSYIKKVNNTEWEPLRLALRMALQLDAMAMPAEETATEMATGMAAEEVVQSADETSAVPAQPKAHKSWLASPSRLATVARADVRRSRENSLALARVQGAAEGAYTVSRRRPQHGQHRHGQHRHDVRVEATA